MVEGLEYLLDRYLEIQPEYALAKLPVRVDILLRKRDPAAELQFPYSHLAATTLVELVTPGEWATWRRLCKLLGESLLYSSREGLAPRADVADWLVASRMSQQFLRLVAEAFGGLVPVGPGVWRAVRAVRPLVLIHLGQLPLTVDALPLLMAYKGRREPEIAEFALEHAGEHLLFLQQAVSLHSRAVREVVQMKTKYPEVYRDLADLRGIIDLFGEERIIQEIGEEKILRGIGEEKILREIGEERVVEDLLKDIGAERLREIVERKTREQGDNGNKPGK